VIRKLGMLRKAKEEYNRKGGFISNMVNSISIFIPNKEDSSSECKAT
jgi:hypothetical protein